ncbi:MAG: hypothetical protein ACTTHG_06655 [Treponemataceae bacterium]
MDFINNYDANEIFSLLKLENEMLDVLSESQNTIRNSVVGKNWDSLESSITKINELTVRFALVDEKLKTLMKKLCIGSNSDFYKMAAKIDDKILSQNLSSLYTDVKRKLIKSKIENKALFDYVKITNNFVQGIFDKVLPQRKNVLYSKNGTLVKNNPNSIVLNAVM